MSIDDNVDVIGSSLQNIKTAIEAKGVTPSGNITTYAAAIGQIQGSTPVEIDGVTITKNTNNELQTVGVINDNSGNAVKVWVGTQAEFDAITTKDPSTMYYITDQEEKPVQSARNIGEIVMSTIPLTDVGLHLLDGTLINGNGTYKNFVDYMKGLVTDYPNLFVSEEDWQTSVSTYGVCGKFVYDSVANTVRLPKITGILEGTTDVTALGDLVEAGLPVHTHTRGTMDITGEVWNFASMQSNEIGITCSGAFGASGRVEKTGYGTATSSDHDDGFSFVASRTWTGSTSNPNYAVSINDTNTVQPQTIKTFYYIVIATSTKTDIQVDIDEIATDLNYKADTDLTNCTDVANIKMAHNAMPSNTDTVFTPAYNTNYTMPADGYLTILGTATANYGYVALRNVTRNYTTIAYGIPVNNAGQTWQPVKKGDVCYCYGWQSTCSGVSFVYAVGSESEAS